MKGILVYLKQIIMMVGGIALITLSNDVPITGIIAKITISVVMVVLGVFLIRKT